MATLVFDIETSALPLEQFRRGAAGISFPRGRKIADAAAQGRQARGNHQFMSLWPFTSQVVCIAMLNAETGAARCLFVGRGF
jgi:hypothetical protein